MVIKVSAGKLIQSICKINFLATRQKEGRLKSVFRGSFPHRSMVQMRGTKGWVRKRQISLLVGQIMGTRICCGS